MILDALQQFSTGQDLFTPAAGAIDSTNTLDYGIIAGIPSSANGGGARDMGIGDDPALEIMIIAATAFVGGTSLAVSVQGAPDDGTGAPGAFTPMANIPAVVTANLDAGQQIGNITVPRPVPGQPMPRFLKLVYTTVGDFSAGTVTAYVVLDRDDQIVGSDGAYSGYPAGIVVAN